MITIEGKCNGTFICPKCLQDVKGCPFEYRNSKGEVIGPCCNKGENK